MADGSPELPGTEQDVIDLRVPVWNVAALLLLASGLAAVNVFLPLGIGARFVTGLAGLAAVITAVIAYRMYFVADQDGFELRGRWRQHSFEWAQLADAGIVERKVNTMHLQLTLTDGTLVDIPQSLTAPGKPVARPIAYKQLAELGRRILDYPDKHGHPDDHGTR